MNFAWINDATVAILAAQNVFHHCTGAGGKNLTCGKRFTFGRCTS